MSDQDAPPSRPGQAVTPKAIVMFAFGPDGQFLLDAPEDEVTGRALLALGMFELDRWYTKKRMEKMLADAKDQRVITGMLGPEDARRFDKKLKGLR